MRHAPSQPLLRWLSAAAALIALAAIAAYTYRSLGTHLWMDELLTIRLADASSLQKLWAGIAVGIDGNPPLYLTLAWLIVHATSALIPDIAALRAMNVAIIGAAVLVLYRISLRDTSRLAAWAGAFLFVSLNATLEVLAFDLRTYAIYFLMSALAVLLQQRLIERGRASNAILLSLSYIALVLSHNFGIVFTCGIALAGLISQWDRLRIRDWRRPGLTLLAVTPALVVFACWLPVFIQQSATGRPYLWIDKPDLSQLFTIVFSSPMAMWVSVVELCCLIAAGKGALRQHGLADGALLRAPDWQFGRYITLLCLGVSAITVGMWTVSIWLFPIFVPRYFVPQLMVSFALHVAFCELLVRIAKERFLLDTARLANAAAIVLPLLFSLTLLRGPVHGREPCTDDENRYFEASFVDGSLPVIAESPHVFLPRVIYAARPDVYRSPLDWDVVLNYPERSRGNATEFHVMERLKAWQPLSTIMTTEAIVRDYPEFLVIEQSGQAWFENLRHTRNVSATKLADVASAASGTCTLWKVTRVSARR